MPILAISAYSNQTKSHKTSYDNNNLNANNLGYFWKLNIPNFITINKSSNLDYFPPKFDEAKDREKFSIKNEINFDGSFLLWASRRGGV